MDLLQPLFDIFNAIMGFFGYLLGMLEQIISPITGLLDRWNKLFPASE